MHQCLGEFRKQASDGKSNLLVWVVEAGQNGFISLRGSVSVAYKHGCSLDAELPQRWKIIGEQLAQPSSLFFCAEQRPQPTMSVYQALRQGLLTRRGICLPVFQIGHSTREGLRQVCT